MSAAIEMPTPINFSDNAVKKVKELIEEEGTPDLNLEYLLVAAVALECNMALHLKRV